MLLFPSVDTPTLLITIAQKVCLTSSKHKYLVNICEIFKHRVVAYLYSAILQLPDVKLISEHEYSQRIRSQEAVSSISAAKTALTS